MLSIQPTSPRLRLPSGILGLLLLLLAFWQVRAPDGLEVVRGRAGEVPVEFIRPAGAAPGSRPLVLVGHGFAGSGVIMRGFAYTLAQAGYAVAVWDFDGHGANPRPLPAGLRGDLLPNAEAVLAEARRLGFGDPGRLAILGHSMGSGVALSFGQQHPETMATIAVSPVGIPVTPGLPRNLLLMAGENEPNFAANARQRLAEAGGEGGDPAAGTARRLVILPWVEHITILLSPAAHRAAREWLDTTFGPQPGALAYTDLRIGWYGLGVLGALLAAVGLVPPGAIPTGARPSGARQSGAASLARVAPAWSRVMALAAGGLGATLLLWLLSRWGIPISGFLGLQVGGILLVWFALAGLIALPGLRLAARGGRAFGSQGVEAGSSRGSASLEPSPRRAPRTGWLGSGLLAAAFLWVGVGLLGNQVWLPWLLIPPRLGLWPLGVLAMLPWFLAVGESGRGANGWGRLGWWLAGTLIVLGSLFLALFLVPGLGFLVLILPVFPLLLGAHALASGRQRHPWSFALGGALFISWAVLAVFPLS